MTLKEFEKVLNENKELAEKFKKAKETLRSEKGKEAEAMSKLISDLGYDVPASEFALDKIGRQELNDEELKAVAGGWYACKVDHYKMAPESEGCKYDYEDTDCFIQDSCDIWNIRYYQHDECKFDYKDLDCYHDDSCNGSFNIYNYNHRFDVS